jgi:ParB-like chromosome segregation protein Spo0J
MTTENILKIKLNEEYANANLVPPLFAKEYESLKEDIKQNGIQIPIITRGSMLQIACIYYSTFR